MCRWAVLLFVVAVSDAQAQNEPEFKLSWLAIEGRRQDTIVADFNGDGKNDILNTAIDYESKPNPSQVFLEQAVDLEMLSKERAAECWNALGGKTAEDVVLDKGFMTKDQVRECLVAAKKFTDSLPPVRWAFVHFQQPDGTFHEAPDTVIQIDDRACMLMIGDFDGDKTADIGFIASDGLYIYPTVNGRISEQPKKILHTRTFCGLPSRNQLPIWQYQIDLDGNGLDDVILPVHDGYKIYFQTSPGKYGRVAKLEIEEQDASRRALRVTSYAEQSRIKPTFFTMEKQLPRLEIVDINGDGRLDLVSIRGNILTVFFQTKEGTFDIRSREQCIVKTLQSEDKEGVLEVSAIYFVDIKGDKKPALVVVKAKGELGLVNSIHTDIYIHQGNGTGQFTGDSTLRIEGLTMNPTFIDMDGDGKLDLMATEVSTGILGKILEYGLLGDMNLNTRFWRFEGAHLNNEPDYTHTETVSLKDIEKKQIASVPMVYVPGDLSGDGRPDLLVVKPNNSLNILRGEKHYGAGGKELIGFETVPVMPPIYLDEYPKYLGFYDINRDGIVDILIYYHSTVGLVLSKRK